MTVSPLVMLARLALVLGLTLLPAACAVVAAGTAGGIIGSEIAEDDGVFDPFENTEVMKTIKRNLN